MKKSRGFTLFELLIVIAIVGILVSLAIPSFQTFFEKNRLRGAAEAVYEQLQHARSLAVKRSQPITVDFFANNTTTWAMGITDDSECWALPDPSICPTWGCDADPLVDPAVTPGTACILEYDNDRTVDYDGDGDNTDRILLRLDSTEFSDIIMTGSGASITPSFDNATVPGICATTSVEETCFEPVQGFARSSVDHIQLHSPNPNYILQVEVDAVGRVRVCVPPGATTFLGYTDC